MKLTNQIPNGEKIVDVEVSLPHRYNEEFIDILEQLYNIMM